MQRIVVPGEKLLDRPMQFENAMVDNGKTYSTVVGVFLEDKGTLIPLEGLWYPRRGDRVIGIVEEEKLNVYMINLNAPYKGILIAKFVRTKLNVGDVIEAEVDELDKTKTVVLDRPRKMFGGKLMQVNPSKIPRIIGKGDTMLKQLTEGTKCTMVVGMNGMVWIKGGDVGLAARAILKIEEEAHTSGLTNRIKDMMVKKTV